jgi:hypothetical protein
MHVNCRSKSPIISPMPWPQTWRRAEKNHDGIRSATTRQHYIQIYQAIKYLSLDIAEFVDKGPRINEVQSV